MKANIRKFSVFPHHDGSTDVVVWRDGYKQTITRRYEKVSLATCTRLENLSYNHNLTRTNAAIQQGYTALFIYRNLANRS